MAPSCCPGLCDGAFVMRRGAVMFDVVGSLERMQGDGLGRGPHIRLRVDHPAWQQAARLLEALGGRRVLPAAGTVYGFLTTPAGENALVRSKLGWTVAEAFLRVIS